MKKIPNPLRYILILAFCLSFSIYFINPIENFDTKIKICCRKLDDPRFHPQSSSIVQFKNNSDILNAVSAGIGTEEDPYVINLGTINATNENIGLSIQNTTTFVLVNNTLIFGASDANLNVTNASNISFNNCTFLDSQNFDSYGAFFKKCENIQLKNISLLNNRNGGILFDNCNNIFFINSIVDAGNQGIRINNCIDFTKWVYCKL